MPQAKDPATLRPRYEIRHALYSETDRLGDIERSAGQVFRAVGLDAVADDEPMPVEVLRKYADQGGLWVAVVDGAGAGSSSAEATETGVHEKSRGATATANAEVIGFLAVFPIIQQHSRVNESGGGTETGSPTAYLHIAELSVHASHQKRGLGRRLLETMLAETTATPGIPCCKTEDGFWEATPIRTPADNGVETTVKPSDLSSTTAQLRGYSLTTYEHLSFNALFYAKMGFRQLATNDIDLKIGMKGRELWEEEQRSIMLPEKRCWMIKDMVKQGARAELGAALETIAA